MFCCLTSASRHLAQDEDGRKQRAAEEVGLSVYLGIEDEDVGCLCHLKGDRLILSATFYFSNRMQSLLPPKLQKGELGSFFARYDAKRVAKSSESRKKQYHCALVGSLHFSSVSFFFPHARVPRPTSFVWAPAKRGRDGNER